MPTPLLNVQQISRYYGSLLALQNISFEVNAGEVVGMTGRSGAGKTSLVQILGGLISADSGVIKYKGHQLGALSNRHEIGIIHEQPELAGQLDVSTNIYLGQEINYEPFGEWVRFPNQRKMDDASIKLLTRLDAPFINLRERTQNLSAEHRQLVAIARVMARPRELIIIDNPSLHLSTPYQQKLLQLIRQWQQNGTAILFSSNNLDHLFAVSDRILALRDSRLVASSRTDNTTREEIVSALVGSKDRTHTPTIWALDSYRQAREQAEMLRHNQRLLERDLRARDALNLQLVDQLGEQVRALDSANLALQDAQRRLLTEREEERKRLAREIHDQAIQDLLSLNYELEDIEASVSAETATTDDIVEIRQSIRTLVEDLRRICGALRPPTIDSLGLPAALRSMSRDWSGRTGIMVEIDVADDFGRLPEELELSIFRIVQEGLNNISKHANATEAQVSLNPTSPRLLLVSIADNGQGLNEAFNLGQLGGAGHYGLLGISERVALMGGRLRFENQQTGGLLVQVEVPHPRIETTDYAL